MAKSHVEKSEQSVLLEDETDDTPEEQDRTSELTDIDPDSLDEVEREPEVDLEQFNLKQNKIDSIETVRVFSPYAKSEDKKSHNVRVTGEVVHVHERDDGEKIEFRPSVLIPLEEDNEGNLKGLPSGEKSKWQKFKKTLKINKPKDAIGKELPIKVTHNKRTGKDWLGYLY